MPPFGEACVCDPWNHRDPFGFCFTTGGQWSFQQSLPNKDTADRMWYDSGTLESRTCNFPLYVWQEAKARISILRCLVVFFALQMRAESRQLVASSLGSFLFGPPLRLKTPRIPWFPTGTLRKWNPRPACGTAIKSVRISMSVFDL